MALFQLKAFKNVLQKPRPDEKNYRYTNVKYRNKKLAYLYGRCTGLREIIEVGYKFFPQIASASLSTLTG